MVLFRLVNQQCDMVLFENLIYERSFLLESVSMFFEIVSVSMITNTTNVVDSSKYFSFV